jgi:hypothetical protein
MLNWLILTEIQIYYDLFALKLIYLISISTFISQTSWTICLIGTSLTDKSTTLDLFLAVIEMPSMGIVPGLCPKRRE